MKKILLSILAVGGISIVSAGNITFTFINETGEGVSNLGLYEGGHPSQTLNEVLPAGETKVVSFMGTTWTTEYSLSYMIGHQVMTVKGDEQSGINQKGEKLDFEIASRIRHEKCYLTKIEEDVQFYGHCLST